MAENELWCCHVIGPDDVHAAPDRETAEKWAASINAFVASREKHPDDPAVTAQVEPWPWSPEDHAKDLPEAIRMMSSRQESRCDDEAAP